MVIGVDMKRTSENLSFIQMMLLLLLVFRKTFQQTQWPAVDKVPPENSEWTSTVLQGLSIPNLPLSPKGTGLKSSNLKSDYHTCLGGVWAFTYDDGPSSFTPSVLDTLEKNNKTLATFFVVGSRIVSNPQPLIDAFKAGHQIALHSWSHPYFTSLTNGQIIAEIVYTANIIASTIGVVPQYFRPPYGNV